MILAGGEGKRLRPITCTMPKPMVPLLNKPTLFYTLDLLKKHGLNDVTIALGYMGDSIRSALGDGSNLQLSIKYSSPEMRLGTAGSIKYALGKNNKDTVLIMSGDGMTDVDLTAAVAAHKSSGAAATLVLYSVAEPGEYGIALTDKQGCITGFTEKPAPGEAFSDLANTGIYIIEPWVFDELPEKCELDFSKDVFPKLLQKGEKLYGYKHKGYWSDIGNPHELLATQRDMLSGRCGFITEAQDNDGVLIEPGAVISPKAKLMPPCYIGREAQIGAYACVEPYSVVCSRAKLEEGCSVKRSVVMRDAILRQGAELRGAILCENAVAEEHSAAYEGAVIGARSVIGKGATVCAEVSIWPEKQVPGGEKCKANVSWGTGKSIKAKGCGFEDSGDITLTPERAVRIAAAYACQFKLPAELAIGCDGKAASVMLKYAAASGAASQGAEVLFAEAGSREAFSALLRHTAASGGIYVKSADEGCGVSLLLYDEQGIEAGKDSVRAVERAVWFGEQKPTTAAELGIIQTVGGGEACLRGEVMHAVDSAAIAKAPALLMLTAPNDLGMDVASILLRLGWRVDSVLDSQKLLPVYKEGMLSIRCDESERITACIAPAVVLDSYSLLAIIAEDIKAETVPMPLDTDSALEKYLESRGVTCLAAPEEASARRRFAADRKVYRAELLEPEYIIVKLCELFARGALQQAAKRLPVCFRRTGEVNAASGDAARMLRCLTEDEDAAVSDIAQGVKLKHDTGWVTVRPMESRAAFKVVAGSSNAEYSRELCDIYINKLKSIRTEGQKQ